MPQMKKRLPAEWEAQDGVLMAWPHEGSDWAPILDKVETVYSEIALKICEYEKLALIVDDEAHVKRKLKSARVNLKNVHFFPFPTNDTWARDFGPITLYKNGKPQILDFVFNAWGMKFAADKDNRLTGLLSKAGAFGINPVKTVGMVLEGGSIESDGSGTIMATTDCMLSPNRNPQMDQKKIEKKLLKLLGAGRVLWLTHGHLAGDDTDSHIDTLARFCPDDGIAYVSCSDKKDEHYADLLKMKKEIEAFRTAKGFPYRLFPLPMPQKSVDENGNRLPSTYANFLVINQAVLVPLYEDPENDGAALKIIGQAFPGREIIGINCLPLVRQHGSLHCITMQLPKGVLL